MKIYSIWLSSIVVIFLFFGKYYKKEAQTFKIDPNHTSITIKVNRFTVVDVLGRFTDVSGSITYDAENIDASSANILIKVSSYTANNKDGENAVKSPAFLDAENYPEITFNGLGLTKKGDNIIAKGNLTIHGTTNEIEFPVKITGPFKDPTGLNSIGLSANIAIDRQDYGIKFDRKLSNGENLIGNLVEIDINILANQ